MKVKKLIFLSALFVLLFATCEDYVENSNIPDAEVDITINLDNPEWSGLYGPYNAVVYRDVCPHCIAFTGYVGVIIMKDSYDQFQAFDLCCTEDPVNDPHRLEVNGAKAICPVDGSEFNLADGFGTVLKGPAKYPLRKYKTSASGNILRIWN